MKNPVKDKKDSYRVIRGGYWNSDLDYLRSAKRSSYTPANRNYYFGFRLVKNIPKDKK